MPEAPQCSRFRKGTFRWSSRFRTTRSHAVSGLLPRGSKSDLVIPPSALAFLVQDYETAAPYSQYRFELPGERAGDRPYIDNLIAKGRLTLDCLVASP